MVATNALGRHVVEAPTKKSTASCNKGSNYANWWLKLSDHSANHIWLHGKAHNSSRCSFSLLTKKMAHKTQEEQSTVFKKNKKKKKKSYWISPAPSGQPPGAAAQHWRRPRPKHQTEQQEERGPKLRKKVT